MKFKDKYNKVVINILISLAMSLVINFSYFIFFLTSSPEIAEKRMHIHADPTLYISLQVIYYALLMFVLVSVVTARLIRPDGRVVSYTQKMVICTIVTIVVYFFAPHANRAGDVMIVMFSRRLFNPMLMLKCSFSLIVAMLYGKIYELIYQKQNIAIENEQLKSENLQSRYNMLMSQINPHFFFNSLNSLSMLIRDRQNDKALEYIDELSDTFRYIIHNGQSGLTTLREEMKFVDAYKYLFEIRYADKLFFEIEVDSKYENYRLPALSLQPLIENAVKHNTITIQKPLSISIKTTGDNTLVVANRIYPKLLSEEGTGIGLDNLQSRYQLLTGENIRIVDDGMNFMVVIPLIEP